MLALITIFPTRAFGQSIDMIDLDRISKQFASESFIQIAILITLISVIPAALICMTSFTRLIISLSILRMALGLQSTPSNIVIITLSIILTSYIMYPVFTASYEFGIKPYLNATISQPEAIEKTLDPFKSFMRKQTRDSDLQLFIDIAKLSEIPASNINDIRILIPAFMISELKRGFEIGFLIAVPFLIIDLIVATIIMSMGMMMMPPSVVSLPIKLLFFVTIDGWSMLIGSLVRSFG